jgi:hypothetical protein
MLNFLEVAMEMLLFLFLVQGRSQDTSDSSKREL